MVIYIFIVTCKTDKLIVKILRFIILALTVIKLFILVFGVVRKINGQRMLYLACSTNSPSNFIQVDCLQIPLHDYIRQSVLDNQLERTTMSLSSDAMIFFIPSCFVRQLFFFDVSTSNATIVSKVEYF